MYKTHQEGEKTHCLTSCVFSDWGHVIYNGTYI